MKREKNRNMIDRWFEDDINKVLRAHRYVVVTDARGEGEFLMKHLPDGVRRIDITDEFSEIEARYRAESECAQDKVVFYAKKKATALTYLQEYVQTAGLVVLDDTEAYIRQKLFEQTGINATIGREKLLLAAKLSFGKNANWWKSVAHGITEPLRLEDCLLDFLNAPDETRCKMDDTVWAVFRQEVYKLICKTDTGQKAMAMAKEVTDAMLHSLLANTISGLLLDVYYQWADSTEKKDTLAKQANNFALPTDANPLKAHTDHPFAALDRKAMKMLSDDMKHGRGTDKVTTYLRRRTESKKARAFKPQWLKSVLTLATFTLDGVEKAHTYDDLATYYQKCFAPLDTAMRKIYVAWLNDEPTLRPLQEHYAKLEKGLLDCWYAADGKYAPTQQGIIAKALDDGKRTAVIVCDGLRLEIAECVVRGIESKDVRLERNVAFVVLPSVTENGMSALYGCAQPTLYAQERYNALKATCPYVEIMQLDKLNDSVTAQHLVLCYGDIDQVGEKKQLAGLKDIDNYEQELREKAAMLVNLGYEKIVITTDHGFVITGILDDADKEPRPNGEIKEIDERYVLTEYPLKANNLVEQEKDYFGSKYQYFAKTDKPFVTRGQYGYSHGGFTPQECVIPVYALYAQSNNNELKIAIANKADLKSVTGNYFTVKLKADDTDSTLFNNERKVKLMLYSGSKLINGSILHAMKPGETFTQEFEMTGGIDKVVITDKETSAQIDSCDIRKSASRDMGDLL